MWGGRVCGVTQGWDRATGTRHLREVTGMCDHRVMRLEVTGDMG